MTATRRAFVAGAAASIAASAHAAAPFGGASGPAFYRRKVGAFDVTAVSDGYWDRPVDAAFVRNAPYAAVRKALADAFMPQGKLSIPFTPLVVNTGKDVVMIDTGSGGQIAPTAGSLVANLKAAGIGPDDIDIILISNFHPDHIDGLTTKDDVAAFAKARIAVPAAEWAFWMSDANLARAQSDLEKAWFLNARRVFRHLAVEQFAPGKMVVPGVSAIAAPGHTPGHCAFEIASGKDALLALCDTTNHPWLFARHPEWQAILDMDGPLAVKTRKRLLDRASADRALVAGYHFPFPPFGHIARTRTGYEFVPAMWGGGP